MIYLNLIDFQSWHLLLKSSESEFNEFEPRLKSAKNRFQLSAGLDLKKITTVLSGINHIWSTAYIQAAAQIL